MPGASITIPAGLDSTAAAAATRRDDRTWQALRFHNALRWAEQSTIPRKKHLFRMDWDRYSRDPVDIHFLESHPAVGCAIIQPYEMNEICLRDHVAWPLLSGKKAVLNSSTLGGLVAGWSRLGTRVSFVVCFFCCNNDIPTAIWCRPPTRSTVGCCNGSPSMIDHPQ